MIDRQRMSQPSGQPAGFQNWSNLAFVHWRVPLAALRQLVPQALTIDTWQDEAWLGMVAFSMSGIRARGFPALPYLCAFPETNLRTYVHLRGGGPGVWFFSLDASRWLAVQLARWGWGLNYCWSRMHVRCSYNGAVDFDQRAVPTKVEYFSHRVSGAAAAVRMCLEIEPGQSPLAAAADSLEYFLCERYLLYTVRRRQLLQARVYHEPYPLIQAHLSACTQSLVDTIGCRVGAADHVIFSPGVRVQVYPLYPAASCG